MQRHLSLRDSSLYFWLFLSRLLERRTNLYRNVGICSSIGCRKIKHLQEDPVDLFPKESQASMQSGNHVGTILSGDNLPPTKMYSGLLLNDCLRQSNRRSEEHTSEVQSRCHSLCCILLE